MKDEYHLIVAAVPGHDLTTNEEFTTVEQTAVMIEQVILRNYGHDILCIYGLSMDGGITIRILADDKIHFQYAMIDVGITPYEIPWIFTRFILLNDYCTKMLGRRFTTLLNYVFPADRFSEEIRKKEVMGLKRITKIGWGNENT